MQDCNEGLKRQPLLVEFAVARAIANENLGRHSASLNELDHVVRLHPNRASGFAMALATRAWFRSTCPDASFRNATQAMRDAKVACKLTGWKKGEMIDTLAAVYAPTGDFDSAVRYEEQAIAEAK